MAIFPDYLVFRNCEYHSEEIYEFPSEKILETSLRFIIRYDRQRERYPLPPGRLDPESFPYLWELETFIANLDCSAAYPQPMRLYLRPQRLLLKSS